MSESTFPYLDFEDYGLGIGNAWTTLRNNAASAGLDAAVGTCPGWSVRDLVVHMGAIHRWATGVITGAPRRPDSEVAAEAAACADLLEWLDDGAVGLLHHLAGAPADLDVWFFLATELPARESWARRQCHETSIHGVDAMAARLGRLPTAAETGLRTRLALDGIDEYLRALLPVTASPAATGTVHVVPDGCDIGWRVDFGSDGSPPAVSFARATDLDPRLADAAIGGGAVDLYLALWHRGDSAAVDGDPTTAGHLFAPRISR